MVPGEEVSEQWQSELPLDSRSSAESLGARQAYAVEPEWGLPRAGVPTPVGPDPGDVWSSRPTSRGPICFSQTSEGIHYNPKHAAGG